MSFKVEQRAFWLALPVTSLVASCSYALIGLTATGEQPRPGDLGEIAKVIGVYTIFMAPFVAFAGLFFGLPIAALLRRLHLNTLPTLLFVGAIAGSLFSGLVLGALSVELTARGLLWAAFIGVLPGATAALVWWYVTERSLLSRDA